jgi:signal peptidase I
MRVRKSRIAVAGALAAIGAASLRGRWRRYEISETSMEPQLSSGDYIAATRAQDLQRGDIVIVPHPEIAGFELIKRVIGLPGETIGLSNGYVHINEIALAEPWANGPTRPDGEWTLGLDEVFVLGDSRQVSAADSRTIGPIDASTVRWRAVARYWPLQSAGRLPTRPFSP